jgi:hypothetical protein
MNMNDDEYDDDDEEEADEESDEEVYYDEYSDMVDYEIRRGLNAMRERMSLGWGWNAQLFDDDDDDEEEDESWNDDKTTELCAQLQDDDPYLTDICTSIFENCSFASQLGPAMVGNTQLLELRLSRVALTDDEAKHLATGIGQSNLQTIAINGPIRLPTIVQQILYQGISKSPTIQDVILDDVPIEVLDGLGDVLLALKQPELLAIENVNQWSPRYGQLVCDALLQRSPITSLKLESVPSLGDDGFMMVAQGLNNNVSLKTLQLIRCDIGDSSISLLVERWHPKSLLECLVLRNNKIGPEGTQLLFRAAAAHPSMQKIDLTHNTGIGFEGLTFIGEELPLQLHLKDVRVGDCFKVLHYDDAMSPKAQKQAEARKQAQYALTKGM